MVNCSAFLIVRRLKCLDHGKGFPDSPTPASHFVQPEEAVQAGKDHLPVVVGLLGCVGLDGRLDAMHGSLDARGAALVGLLVAVEVNVGECTVALSSATGPP